MTNKLLSENNQTENFQVFTIDIFKNDQIWKQHWSEGLEMIIKKDGVTICLNGEELKQLVKSLPRTFGGKY